MVIVRDLFLIFKNASVSILVVMVAVGFDWHPLLG